MSWPDFTICKNFKQFFFKLSFYFFKNKVIMTDKKKENQITNQEKNQKNENVSLCVSHQLMPE